MANLAYCHIRAYELIHKIRREMGYTDTKVSFAHHLRVFDPERTGKFTPPASYAELLDHFFQGLVTRAFFFAKFSWPLVPPPRWQGIL